jgi:5,10-methylene-tetrahydrofolate dehydrogenase/methenyl tetrahydrofolate cyclohydrolase
MKEGVNSCNQFFDIQEYGYFHFIIVGDDVKIKSSIFVAGVGKVTVSMLERNLVRLCEYQSN